MIILSTLSATSVYSQVKPRFEDSIATRDMRNDFFILNLGMGFLSTTKNLELEQQQEFKKFQDSYEKLKSKYKSAAMDNIWSLSEDKITDGQKQAALYDQQLSNKFNAQYASGSGFIHAYQCTYSKGNADLSEYVSKLNEVIRGVRHSLFVLEKRLPEKTNSGGLMMTNEQWSKVDGNTILCKKFENGKLIEQTPIAVIEKVEKTRIPPYSVSKNPQHEMMCRNLSDPRIPPPPPIKCAFNYQ